MSYEEIENKVRDTLIKAGSVYPEDKKYIYNKCISETQDSLQKWALQNLLDNGLIAEDNKSPLCDDTGIPHIILEVGRNREINGDVLEAIYSGVRKGLDNLPGRPMAVIGNDVQRIEQKDGLYESSSAVACAPIMLKYVEDPDKLSVTVLMQGGGPEIRSKTYRVFHKHNINVVVDEIVGWAKEIVGQLGCTPCTLAVGIGRSHYEASSMMLQAMSEGNYRVQNEIEKEITDRVNESGVGPLGLGGKVTVLGTFLKVGPQRASGVRIVCMRPCCCFEPRCAKVEL